MHSLIYIALIGFGISGLVQNYKSQKQLPAKREPGIKEESETAKPTAALDENLDTETSDTSDSGRRGDVNDLDETQPD